jgi:hypothetical protein
MQPTAANRNKTRRASSPGSEGNGNTPSYALNTGLEQFLNLNASEAYKRPWHRLERGLRLNRIRKFIETETARMNLEAQDVEHLTNLLHRALDKKLLNSKTCVVYDPEKEEIQEIKGLVYHKAADGRIISQIIEKKSAITLRRKTKAEKVDSSQVTAQNAQNAQNMNVEPTQTQSQQ